MKATLRNFKFLKVAFTTLGPRVPGIVGMGCETGPVGAIRTAPEPGAAGIRQC